MGTCSHLESWNDSGEYFPFGAHKLIARTLLTVKMVTRFLSLLARLVAIVAVSSCSAASNSTLDVQLESLQFGIGAVCSNEIGHSLTVYGESSSVLVTTFGRNQGTMRVGTFGAQIHSISCAGLMLSFSWVIAVMDNIGRVRVSYLTPSGWTDLQQVSSGGVSMTISRLYNDSFVLVVTKTESIEVVHLPSNYNMLASRSKTSWSLAEPSSTTWVSTSEIDGEFHLLVGTSLISRTQVYCEPSPTFTCTVKDGRKRFPVSAMVDPADSYSLSMIVPVPTGLETFCSRPINLLTEFPAVFSNEGSASMYTAISNTYQDTYLVGAIMDTPTVTRGLAFLVRLTTSCSDAAEIIQYFPLPTLSGSKSVVTAGTIAFSGNTFIWGPTLKRSSGENDLHVFQSTNITNFLSPIHLDHPQYFYSLAPTPMPTPAVGGGLSNSSWFEANGTAVITSISLIGAVIVLAVGNGAYHAMRYGDDMRRLAPIVAEDDKSSPTILKAPKLEGNADTTSSEGSTLPSMTARSSISSSRVVQWMVASFGSISKISTKRSPSSFSSAKEPSPADSALQIVIGGEEASV